MRILVGLPASGKSTYAHELMGREPGVWARISWDDIRHETPNYKFNKTNETRVVQRADSAAREAASEGFNLLIDNTNLHAGHITRWTGLAEELGMQVELKKFNASVQECVQRDALREGKYAEGGKHVGRVIIERMALANGLIQFPEDRQIVIVDVDGTLADCGHRRRTIPKNCQPCKGTGKAKDYDMDTGTFKNDFICHKCEGKGHVTGTDWKFFYTPELILQDPPFSNIVNLIRNLYGRYTILIVSGRGSDIAGEGTVAWLQKNEVPYDHIFMRAGGDHRDDVEVKQDILNKLPKDKIAFSVDDRDRVVKMWRDNGITCLQVAEGDF
jgi:predicted kinase